MYPEHYGRQIPASVNIKIYRAPKDWKHVLEEEVILELNGDLSLNKVTRPADYAGECRVSIGDPMACAEN